MAAWAPQRLHPNCIIKTQAAFIVEAVRARLRTIPNHLPDPNQPLFAVTVNINYNCRRVVTKRLKMRVNAKKVICEFFLFAHDKQNRREIEEMRHPSLLDRRRAGLAIIDMQEAFRQIIGDFAEIAGRIALMAEVCHLLKIPIIITEQYPKGLGHTVGEIAQHFSEGIDPIEKLSFSACGVQEFNTRLREKHIEQLMICGIEAHICVSQTAHDLLQNGYQIHLLSDAVGARLPHNREVGIDKMIHAGAIISSIETAIFELTQAGTEEFKIIQAKLKVAQ